MSASQLQKAEKFHAMHFSGKPLLLPNVWDGMSTAACVAAGFEAIATTSCGIAWSLGYPDGECMARGEMIAAIKRIARVAGDTPVSADIESGYACNDAELAETITAVIEAGAIGINIEDRRPGVDGDLLSIDEATHRIRLARRVAQRLNLPLVINARVDVYLSPMQAAQTRDHETLARGKAYLAAGADCVFPIGLRDATTFAMLVHELNAPVNAMHTQGQLSYEALCSARVARISTASTLALHHFDYLRRTVGQRTDPEQFTALCADTSYPQMQQLFTEVGGSARQPS